jgi:hypothetical protein
MVAHECLGRLQMLLAAVLSGRVAGRKRKSVDGARSAR